MGQRPDSRENNCTSTLVPTALTTMGKCFKLLKKIEFLCQNFNDFLKKNFQKSIKFFSQISIGSQKFIRLLRNFIFIIILKEIFCQIGLSMIATLAIS
jgi:hypothetical protein